MSKKIATYNDLLEEKQRLQQLLAIQRDTIAINVDLLKEELKPVSDGISNVVLTLSRLGKQTQQSPLVYFGIDLATQMVLRRWLKMKTSWFTRSVVPFVIRYYLTKLAAENNNPFWQRIKKAFSK